MKNCMNIAMHIYSTVYMLVFQGQVVNQELFCKAGTHISFTTIDIKDRRQHRWLHLVKRAMPGETRVLRVCGWTPS